MTKTATPVSSITLPTWTDPTSVAVLLSALLSFATGIIAAVHPGFALPAVATDAVPPVSLVVAGVAIMLNVIRHARANTVAVGALAAGQMVIASSHPKVLVAAVPPAAVAPITVGELHEHLAAS